jgi:hypothetical protein
LPRRTAHDVLGTAHGLRRADDEHSAGDQPVERHADRGEVLLDGRLGRRGLQRLDIGGDVQRLDIGKIADVVPVEPGEERPNRPIIGQAGVAVVDLGGEEFEETARDIVAGGGDHRRQSKTLMPLRSWPPVPCVTR